MTRLVLVRHGETDENAAGIFQGHAGGPLNAKGIEQAERLADRLAPIEFDACYGSDQPRARQTAEILLRRHEHLVPLWTRALRELYMGLWQGKTSAEIRLEFPDEFRAWSAGQDVRRGGGETYAEGGARVAAALGGIAAAFPGGTVLVVSHGAVLRAAIAQWMGLALDALGPLKNTAVTVLDCALDGSASHVLQMYNDSSHAGPGPLQRLSRAIDRVAG